MFKTKVLCDNDYDLLCSWFRNWGWQEVPARNFLPNNGKGGLMVLDDDRPIMAGFFYITNSCVGWLAWVISDKKYEGLRLKAINMLIENLTEVCRNAGCKYVYTITNHKVLKKVFSNLGYIQGGEVVEMIKTL
ncbi:MAG: hypothetical protein WCY09_08575 [Candidatus Omnitrophota bacterium]|jgi:hypothetical protein